MNTLFIYHNERTGHTVVCDMRDVRCDHQSLLRRGYLCAGAMDPKAFLYNLLNAKPTERSLILREITQAIPK